MEDYGPVYGFWLFAYERYNGILGDQPNNSRAIEPQLMNRFLKDNLAYSFEFPNEFSDDFSPVCSKNHQSLGSVRDTLSSDEDNTAIFTSAGTRAIFDETDIQLVLTLYEKFNSREIQHEICNVTVNSIFLRYTSLSLCGKTYSCSRSRTGLRSQCTALAEWNESIFGPPPTPLPDGTHPDSKNRPVKIRH